MIHTIKNEFLSVGCDSLGAELSSIKSLKTNFEYLWQGDAAYWTSRAYNLFPIIGRMFKQTYFLNGKEYKMELHGIVRKSQLELVEKTETSMTFVYRSNEESFKIYPFHFNFFVTYTLEKNKLTHSFKVENLCKDVMYFGIGGHPGFNIPFDGGVFEDYYLQFQSEGYKRVIFSPDGLVLPERNVMPLKGGVLNLEHYLFDNDAVIFEDYDGKVAFKKRGSNREIVVNYSDFKYVGFWQINKPDAPYVCVEPWSMLPANNGEYDHFESKEDIFTLQPDGVLTKKFTMEINE